MDLDEAVFGEHAISMTRLSDLVHHLPAYGGALYMATARSAPAAAMPAPDTTRTVTSLRGVSLSSLFGAN